MSNLNKSVLELAFKGEIETELQNIVLVTSNADLQLELIADFYCICVADENLTELKQYLIENKENVEKLTFYLLMDKKMNDKFISEIDTTFAKINIDIDSWKIRNKHTEEYFLRNVEELKGYVLEYAEKKAKLKTSADYTLVFNDFCDFNSIKGKRVALISFNDSKNKNIIENILNYCYCLKVVTIKNFNKPKNELQVFIKNSLKKAKTLYPCWLTINDNGKTSKNQDFLAWQIVKNENIIQVINVNKTDTYIYKDGVYTLVGDDFLRKKIGSYAPVGEFSKNFINNVLYMITCRSPIIEFHQLNDYEQYINFKNGILDVETGKLYAHSPNFYFTYQIQCNYNSEVAEDDGRIFKSYLKHLCTDALTGVYDEEKAKHLQLWGGLTISNIAMSTVKACLCLVSKNGNTGKTIYLNILTELLGVDNVANIPIQDLAKPFATSSLYGKRANIIGDQKKATLNDSSIFKQFTGGDPINIEFKGKTAFSIFYKGGLLFACNNLPYIADDKGTHIYDRLHIIPFNNVVESDKRDPKLLHKMLAKDSEYIAWWLVQGLKEFIANGYKIPRCKASIDAVETFREDNDNLYSFLINNYELTKDDGDRVLKTDLEEAYYKWCEVEEIPTHAQVNKNNFKNILTSSYNIPFTKIRGQRYYKRIKSKTVVETLTGAEIEKEAKQVFKQEKLKGL